MPSERTETALRTTRNTLRLENLYFFMRKALSTSTSQGDSQGDCPRVSEMIKVDEDINVNEVAIYDVVIDYCKIPIPFSC